MYGAIQWYVWCAENYPELGFCPAYAMELDSMKIPGNPKGEAVRRSDPESGPIHRLLELPLIINALKHDRGASLLHLQQRAAVALSLALGRNPANLTYLQETDLVDMMPDGPHRLYVIRMPRIKKRQLDPRDSLIDEYLDPVLVQHLLLLIEKNKDIDTIAEIEGKRIILPRPLFINVGRNKAAMASGLWKNMFNMCSFGICELVQGFVRRHNLVSPITQMPLHITIRRLRYSLASNLAAEGISKRELARVLDHTSTQSVNVYFEVAGRIVQQLDKAAAKGFAQCLSLFRGTVIDRETEDEGKTGKRMIFVHESEYTNQTEIGACGKKAICHLDPPYSCYLCPKFRPYSDADHEYVLDCLLTSRTERMRKFEQNRVGVQLDDVIIAVANVALICNGRN
jgi:hypothetical protein